MCGVLNTGKSQSVRADERCCLPSTSCGRSVVWATNPYLYKMLYYITYYIRLIIMRYTIILQCVML